MTLWCHRGYHVPSLMQFNLPWLNAVAFRSLSKVWLRGLEHARLLCPPRSPGVCSDSCLLSQWCYLTISSSATPFSFWLQSFPASGSFPVSQFFTSGGHGIEMSASASVLPMNIKDWSPLGWTGWISLQSKGLSRVFSNTTVQKHQFFSAQPSLQSNFHIHTWLQGEKKKTDFTISVCRQSDVFAF